jgi:hypothetical protein
MELGSACIAINYLDLVLAIQSEKKLPNLALKLNAVSGCK